MLVVGLLSLTATLAAYAGAACGLTGCSAAATQTGINVAVTVANGLCALAAQQPKEPAWEAWVCKVEGGIATVLVPAGTMAAAAKLPTPAAAAAKASP